MAQDAPAPASAPALHLVAPVTTAEGPEADAREADKPEPGERQRRRLDTFEPSIAPHRRPHRTELLVRTLIYVGIALAVAVLVFSIISMMETRDLAPRTIIAP